ncbi:hypothetical protein QM646_04975 [Rhodococcus erythropolis]|nr:hypothetical protein [Rhodococcus erythropolis]
MPIGNPFPHVLPEHRNRGVYSAAKELVGEIPEPTLDPIDLGRLVGGMDMEPWMFHQPVPDGDGFVGREVVADDMHVEFGRDWFVDRDQRPLDFDGPMPAVQGGNDSASTISKAANKLVTPEQTQSWL